MDSESYNVSGALNGTKLFVSSRTCVPGAKKVETVQESAKKKECLTDLRYASLLGMSNAHELFVSLTVEILAS